MKQNKETGKFEREYQINEKFFETIDSEEKAYVLGFCMRMDVILFQKMDRNL